MNFFKEKHYLEKHFNKTDVHAIRCLINFKNANSEIPKINFNDVENERVLHKLFSSLDLKNEILYFDHNELSSFQKIFLKDMNELHRIIMNKLNVTASQEMAKEKIIQDISRSTQKLKVKIVELENSLQSEEEKLTKTVAEKNTIIQQFENEIENMKLLGDLQVAEEM